MAIKLSSTVFFVALTITTNAKAIPHELLSCDRSNFTLSELKEYSKSELMDAYCNCIALEDAVRKLVDAQLNITRLERERKVITGSFHRRGHDYRDYEKHMSDVDKSLSGIDAAKSNASRMLRVLSKTHNLKGEPNCEKEN